MVNPPSWHASWTSSGVVRRVVHAVGLALLAGCGGATFANGVYRGDHVVFRVGPLPPRWRQVDAKSDVAFRAPGGGTIYANVECKKEDAPLDILANNLIYGIDVKSEQRREITIAGRKGLRVTVQGEMDGVPIGLDAIVMMKNGCIYDLGLTASPEELVTARPDFDRFVEGFEAAGGERSLVGEKQEGWACSVEPC